MKRYILTGTPGSGKTAILRMLELRGHAVVEEAATDVMAAQAALGVAEPWTAPTFVDDILALQIRRRARARRRVAIQFHDRSPACTYALSRWLGHPASVALANELKRVKSRKIFEDQVFFIQNLGFCAPTLARRISFEDSLAFERVHEETYRGLGYELVMIPAAPLEERVERIELLVSGLARPT